MVKARGYQFLAMLRRVVRTGSVGAALDGADQRLLRSWPALENWCRYVVVTLRR